MDVARIRTGFFRTVLARDTDIHSFKKTKFLRPLHSPLSATVWVRTLGSSRFAL